MQPGATKRSRLRVVVGYSWDGGGQLGARLRASCVVPKRFDSFVSDGLAAVQALGVDPEQDFHVMPGGLGNVCR